MIYLIGNARHKICKIGYTKSNAERRLAAIQTGCPHPLSLMAVIEGEMEDERRLHQQFCDRRMNGEWFSVNQAIMDAFGVHKAMFDDFVYQDAGELFKLGLRGMARNLFDFLAFEMSDTNEVQITSLSKRRFVEMCKDAGVKIQQKSIDNALMSIVKAGGVKQIERGLYKVNPACFRRNMNYSVF